MECLLSIGAESFVFLISVKNLKMKIYRTRTCLYGCETSSVTLREERSLRVFENMALRRIFRHKRVQDSSGMEKTT